MPLLRALGLLGSDAVSMHRGIQSSRTDEDSGAAVGQHREAGGGGPKGFRREPSDAAGVQVHPNSWRRLMRRNHEELSNPNIS
jgi:hypothetical protein